MAETENLSLEKNIKGGGISASLDQWRGLALIMVLLNHGFYHTGMVAGLGRAGVNLFFFISGLLVYRSINSSHQRKRPLQVALDFWKRRAKRLLPALWFFLIIVSLFAGLVQWVGGAFPGLRLETFWEHAFRAAIGLGNYTRGVPDILHHLWSIGCEMQFYLLAPFIFYAGGRTLLSKFIVYGSILALFIAFGIRAMLNLGTISQFHFESAVWPMMLGFACAFIQNHIRSLIVKLAPVVWGVCLLSVTILAFLIFSGTASKVVTVAIGLIALGGCYTAYLTEKVFPKSIGKIFEVLGQQCYSIYLFQQCFTIADIVHPKWQWVGALISIPVGMVSYKYFELPYLSKRGNGPDKSGSVEKRQLLTLLAYSCFVGLFIVGVKAVRLNYWKVRSEALSRHQVGAVLAKTPLSDFSSKKVMFLGDSRAAGLAQQEYPAGWRVVNAGVPGQTTNQICARLRDEISSLTPDVAIVQAGINDLKLVGLSPRHDEEIIQHCTDNLKKILSELSERGIGVVWCPILPAGPLEWGRQFVWSDKIPQAIRTVNNEIESFCREKGIYVLKYSKHPDWLLPNDLYKDALHLKDEGYKLFSLLITDLLKN